MKEGAGIMLAHGELTGEIIGAAIEVHRKLGPGFLEKIYEAALCIELTKRRIRHDRQAPFEIFYEGHNIGKHRLDLLVEDTILVDLKTVKAFDDTHLSIARSALRAAGKRHGLLLNFARSRLQVRRVIT